MTTKIVIADDHLLVRAGIVALLNEIPGVVVIGEASNGEEVLELIDELLPDILFLDLAMPKMSGLDVLARINERCQKTKVIILSMQDSPEHVRRALQLGASGYLLKDALPVELRQAIKATEEGKRWLSSSISETVIDCYIGHPERQRPLRPLTERQTQVLKMIAEGLSTKQISHSLNLSVKTIETFRAQIMERLNINDIAGLVKYAIRNCIVSL